MDIAIDDDRVCKIKLYIASQHSNMLNRINELKTAQKENMFLTDVVHDYIKYFTIIKQQQTEQYEALRKITDYIDSIHETSDATEYLLRESKQDQHEILERMNLVKEKINNITNILDS